MTSMRRHAMIIPAKMIEFVFLHSQQPTGSLTEPISEIGASCFHVNPIPVIPTLSLIKPLYTSMSYPPLSKDEETNGLSTHTDEIEVNDVEEVVEPEADLVRRYEDFSTVGMSPLPSHVWIVR